MQLKKALRRRSAAQTKKSLADIVETLAQLSLLPRTYPGNFPEVDQARARLSYQLSEAHASRAVLPEGVVAEAAYLLNPVRN